ncbi:hypothetical protein [Novisyntrophococcus fermenticellae]|uniref:hypothetical protein n=1 Tax=Novisyntrophococcus fermenticellae TaxID=2068655 RepID=UPI001E3366FB|nr:hypothetical protein [Novisyntrophococcus fermenticellae]
MLLISVLGFLISFIFTLISGKQKQKNASGYKMTKRVFWIEIIIALLTTVCFDGRIVYSAIPYHGALSWKIDECMRAKKIAPKHHNFFEDTLDTFIYGKDKKGETRTYLVRRQKDLSICPKMWTGMVRIKAFGILINFYMVERLLVLRYLYIFRMRMT